MNLGNRCVLVVGATGLVGRELLKILRDRGVPASRLRVAAKEETSGSELPYGEETLLLGRPSRLDFGDSELVFLCASAEVALDLAPRARASGCLVIDNSSAFRADTSVPLLVPGVNDACFRGQSLIANPNCSAILLVRALEPLRAAFGLQSIVLSTYQAVSGAGQAGLQALRAQTKARLEGAPEPVSVFPESCAFNVFSHDSAVELETGVNGEERKIIEETRRIWAMPELRITPTCLRVPVEQAHLESIVVELTGPVSTDDVLSALKAGGLQVRDDRRQNQFPTPRLATGSDEVWVGRIRPDPACPLDERGRSPRFALIACADQVRVGAALNAVRIAELAMTWRKNAEGPRNA